MKKYIFSTIAIAMMMTMVACSSSDNDVADNISENKTVKMTFTAIQENNVGTRTTLGGESGKQVIWESDDKINVNGREYTLKEGVGTNKGTFEGYTTTGYSVFLAVYPYVNIIQTADFNSFEITFPSQQSAQVGTFDKSAAFMMAKATQENTTLNFKNAVALVKVTPKFACSKIELKAGDNTVPLAGTGYLSYNGGEPKIDLTSDYFQDKSYSITLNGPIEKDRTYYIAVPTVTLNAGWSISFTASDGTVFTRKGKNSIEFERNTIINLGSFSKSEDYWELLDNGNVSATQQVDMGVFTISGKQYRVIFTKSNLTKDGLANDETKYGDYFAWGATEPWYESISIEGTNVQATSWKQNYLLGYSDDSYTTYLNGVGIVENGELRESYDVAHYILHGDWQIPTNKIWQALTSQSTEKCWVEDRKGYLFEKDGKSIFLPAAGVFGNIECSYVGIQGFYWSNTASSETSSYYLSFVNTGIAHYESGNRLAGCSVRPVRLIPVD